MGGGFINRTVWELKGRWEAFFIDDLCWAFLLLRGVCVCIYVIGFLLGGSECV